MASGCLPVRRASHRMTHNKAVPQAAGPGLDRPMAGQPRRAFGRGRRAPAPVLGSVVEHRQENSAQRLSVDGSLGIRNGHELRPDLVPLGVSPVRVRSTSAGGVHPLV